MSEQHLSDEAVAAFADGVLGGRARERARAHTARCAECAHAVAVQREAVWALRAAPAPALPSSLVDRLRQVPMTTPLPPPTTVLGQDGSTLLNTFGAAAFVSPGRKSARPAPPSRSDAVSDQALPEQLPGDEEAAPAQGGEHSDDAGVAKDGGHRHFSRAALRPLVLTTAAVAAAGVLTVSSASPAGAQGSAEHRAPATVGSHAQLVDTRPGASHR